MLVLCTFTCSITLEAADPQKIKTVSTVGSSLIYGDDEAGARQRAIANSLVYAVEKVSSSMVPLDALVINFQKVSDILYSNTGKFIQGYKVLTEARSGKYYRVMVQANVLPKMIMATLKKGGVIISENSQLLPKVLFIVAEKNIGEDRYNFWWEKGNSGFKGFAEISAEKALAEKGFQIVNHSSGVAFAGLVNPLPNRREAVETARMLGAEIVIVGAAVSNTTSNVMGESKTFTGSFEARAIYVSNSEEIAGVVKDGVGASPDDTEGGMEALINAGKIGGDELARLIIQRLDQKSNKSDLIEVRVTGNLPGYFSKVVIFRRTISTMTGVSEITTMEMSSKLATILVGYRGNAKELGGAIMYNTFEGFGIAITSVEGNVVNVELVAK